MQVDHTLGGGNRRRRKVNNKEDLGGVGRMGSSQKRLERGKVAAQIKTDAS